MSNGWGNYHGPIVVEDGAWLAANVLVLGGVTIGRGAIVTAGSVVFRDVKPHTMVGGNPAEFMMTISEKHRRPQRDPQST
jgi:acetyltransferase-like isoleucine patch superfamily enzyme